MIKNSGKLTQHCKSILLPFFEKKKTKQNSKYKKEKSHNIWKEHKEHTFQKT